MGGETCTWIVGYGRRNLEGETWGRRNLGKEKPGHPLLYSPWENI
jgi:hypothetical protein